MRMFIFSSFLALASGCAYFAPLADRVADAVRAYCKEPAQARAVLEQAINDKLSPSQVKVVCAGDSG